MQNRFLTPGSSAGLASTSAAAELLVCVVSGNQNRKLRDIIRETWGRDREVRTPIGPVSIRVLFFLTEDGAAARSEYEETGDVVLLRHMEESCSSIWLKTAATMKFGSDYFRGIGSSVERGSGPLRFMIKCDDDAFLDIDAIAADLVKTPPVGAYWGHILALVEPNRIAGDKYYVPFEVYPMQYYPPYARGMAYALSEDLVAPLGDALFSGRVDPFPYREDVSVGLYLMELARQGDIKVTPHQRKDQMPLDISEY